MLNVFRLFYVVKLFKKFVNKFVVKETKYIPLEIWNIILEFIDKKLVFRLINKNFCNNLIYNISVCGNYFLNAKNVNIIGQKIGFNDNFDCFCIPGINELTCGMNAYNYNFHEINPVKLKLYNSSRISDNDIKHMTNVTCFCSFETRISDDGLINIYNLTTLLCDNYSLITNLTLTKNLNIVHLKCSLYMTNEGILMLNNLLFLVCNKRISGEIFKKHKNLIVLCFMNNNFINDNDIIKLNKLKILHTGTNITSNGIKNLYNLQKINCKASKYIYDEGIRDLIYLTELTCNKNFTNHGLIKLKRLTYLHLGDNMNITNWALYNKHCLKQLYCGNNNNISNDGLKNLKELEILDCMNNYNITFSMIKTLKKLTHIMCNLKYIYPEQIISTKNINKISVSHNISDSDVWILKNKLVSVHDSMLTINSIKYSIFGILERNNYGISKNTKLVFYGNIEQTVNYIYVFCEKYKILDQISIKLYENELIYQNLWNCLITFKNDSIFLNKCRVLSNDLENSYK